MTFTILRALHSIIGDAIDDIERIYSDHRHPTTPPFSPPPEPIRPRTSSSDPYVSPPPTPSAQTHSPDYLLNSQLQSLDFPSLDAVYDPTSPGEVLTSDPAVVASISRIVAAAGQLSASVQNPFLTLCDAAMGYHLPSCLRLLEASHTIEILREAGPVGLHVSSISKKNGVEKGKLAHILRLLCTHHILREVSPDVFTLNRISSMIDSKKSLKELREYEKEGMPELKYRETDGVAAFVGLCTDELQKSSAYLTEAYLLSPCPQTRLARDPLRAPFCFAFGCTKESSQSGSKSEMAKTRKEGVGFFGWLEGEGDHPRPGGVEVGAGAIYPPAFGLEKNASAPMPVPGDEGGGTQEGPPQSNANRFRLERFGKAMSGTGSWEVPGGVLNVFPWHTLPRGSVIVDVGGGIGSTTMVLASAYASPPPRSSPFPPSPSSPAYCSGSAPVSAGPGEFSPSRSPGSYYSTPSSGARAQNEIFTGGSEHGDLGLRFVIQDRAVVCDMGEKAWRTQCPSLLDSGAVRFQVHDFFTAQPIANAAIFYLRVILHDWPDAFAQRILLRLREAALDDTKLIIGDFVLPLACVDDMGATANSNSPEEKVEGAESRLAPAPLLANLGKASAVAYWMDLTMQVAFNGQERTLREIVALTASAGWKVTKVFRATGSLFGHLIAIPVPIPTVRRARADSGSAFLDVGRPGAVHSLGDSTTAKHGVQTRARGTEEEARQKEIIERAGSRCGTPTFGSRIVLPSVEEAMARFGINRRGGRYKGTVKPSLPPRPVVDPGNGSEGLKSPLILAPSIIKKKRPSPLSVPSHQPDTSQPSSPDYLRPIPSPRLVYHPVHDMAPNSAAPPRLRRTSHLSLRQHTNSPSQRLDSRNPTPGPLSPRHANPSAIPPLVPTTPKPIIKRRASLAQLSSGISMIPGPAPPVPALPAGLGSPAPLRQGNIPQLGSPLTTRTSQAQLQPKHTITRRASFAHLTQPPTRARSGSVANGGTTSLRSVQNPRNSLIDSAVPGVGMERAGGLSLRSGARAAGGVLRFERKEGAGSHPAGGSENHRMGSGTVLAAAVRIERGTPRTPSPS